MGVELGIAFVEASARRGLRTAQRRPTRMSHHPKGYPLRVPADESVTRKARLMEKLVRPQAHSSTRGNFYQGEHPDQLHLSGKDIQLMDMPKPAETNWWWTCVSAYNPRRQIKTPGYSMMQLSRAHKIGQHDPRWSQPEAMPPPWVPPERPPNNRQLPALPYEPFTSIPNSQPHLDESHSAQRSASCEPHLIRAGSMRLTSDSPQMDILTNKMHGRSSVPPPYAQGDARRSSGARSSVLDTRRVPAHLIDRSVPWAPGMQAPPKFNFRLPTKRTTL